MTTSTCTLCHTPEDPTGNTPPMILLAGKYPVCTACYNIVATSLKAVHIDAVDGARLAAAVIDNYSLTTGVDIEIEADRQKLADAVAPTCRSLVNSAAFTVVASPSMTGDVYV